MIYLDGMLWLMSPAYPHERLKKRLGWIVEEIVRTLRIPCIATGSTTFRVAARRVASRAIRPTTWPTRSGSAAKIRST